MGPRELENVARAVGGVDNLIDPKHPDAKTLSYYAYDLSLIHISSSFIL